MIINWFSKYRLIFENKDNQDRFDRFHLFLREAKVNDHQHEAETNEKARHALKDTFRHFFCDMSSSNSIIEFLWI